MSDGRRVSKAVFHRAIFSLAVLLVLLAVALFLPAGDIRWVRGWLFLLIFFILTVPSVVYLWHVNPDIFVARATIHAGTKRWDKVLLAFLLPSFLAIFPVAALDAGRGHGSGVPLWLLVLGYILLSAGFLLSVWAESVNKFAEPGVRIQTERGQTAIDTGPYAIVRHPIYLGALLLLAGIPLSLGSFWALVPAAVATLLVLVRTVLEDRTLRSELHGYKEYAARVRHRLIPGIW